MHTVYTHLSVYLFISHTHDGLGFGCTFQEKQESLYRFFVGSLIGFAQHPVALEHRRERLQPWPTASGLGSHSYLAVAVVLGGTVVCSFCWEGLPRL